MVNIDNYTYTDDHGETVMYAEDAQAYAKEVAKEAINKLQASQATTIKGATVNNEIQQTANAVVKETSLNAKLIGGEMLLENIETLAEKMILSRLPWYKRLTISKADKEAAITLATYAIVHAIKTGGFGLTSFRINHAALDFVTIAANHRLLKYVQRAVGIDTNIAEMLLSAPTITKLGE